MTFAQLPYTYCVEELCDEAVMMPLAGVILGNRLRLEVFNDGAATDQSSEQESKEAGGVRRGRMPTHQLQQF